MSAGSGVRPVARGVLGLHGRGMANGAPGAGRGGLGSAASSHEVARGASDPRSRAPSQGVTNQLRRRYLSFHLLYTNRHGECET